MCVSCGSNDPGFNCMWQKSFTECGPCASHTTCPSCLESYNEGDLIIQCVQCERFVLCYLPFYLTHGCMAFLYFSNLKYGLSNFFFIVPTHALHYNLKY
jgi:hypothetical protein